jgi:hypothetical protein
MIYAMLFIVGFVAGAIADQKMHLFCLRRELRRLEEINQSWTSRERERVS